jgi:hypothetical protein
MVDGAALALWWSDGFTDNRLQLRFGIQSWASEELRAATGLALSGVNLVEATSPPAEAPWPDWHPGVRLCALATPFDARRVLTPLSSRVTDLNSVEYMLAPNEGHSIDRRENQIR